MGRRPETNQQGIIYVLNQYKLPVNIYYCDSPYSLNFMNYTSNLASFYYVNDSPLLDSANAYFGNSLNAILSFKMVYTGANITFIHQTYSDNGSIDDDGYIYLGYSNNPNVFRSTDSLIYIYTYPYTTLSNQPPEMACYFAETFSGSTWNSIQLSGPLNGAYYPDTTSTVSCTLNGSGKILSEQFSNPFLSVGNKFYTYK